MKTSNKSTNDARPLYALALATAIGLIIAVETNKPKPLTFEQRWAPVYDIDAGVKGDRLDRKTPTSDAPDAPSGHSNRVHEVGPSFACHWRTCKIT